MAVYEVRVDGDVKSSYPQEQMNEAAADYESAISIGEFTAKVELCKVITIESVEHGLVIKKRRGRKAKSA